MRPIAILVGLAVSIGSCTAAVAVEPQRLTVQHCLVGFKRSVPNKTLERTKAEAETLAKSILDRALAGEDFDALVKQFTDDAYPGVYVMVNHGVTRRSASEFERAAMAAAFGDVAFTLEVGEVGLAKYHAVRSPYGWHILKRLE